MKLLKEQAITESNLGSSTVPADDYPAWSNASPYSSGARVIFGIEAWESLINSNNDQPDVGAAKPTPTWLRLGFINRWRMFRDGTDSRTESDEDIVVTLTPSGFITGVALLGMTGDEATVTVKDEEDVLVYERVQQITDYFVGNWYDWYFSPYTMRQRLVFLDLAPYAGAEITISITKTVAGEAAIGRVVLGQFQQLGLTQYSSSVSRIDFSKKERDGFGHLQLVGRRNVSLVKYNVITETAAVDNVERLLTQVINTPALFVGSEKFDSLIVYGLYRDFSINLAGVNDSDVTIEVEEF